jgi:hypothetical protein
LFTTPCTNFLTLSAIAIAEPLLADQERVLGRDHPDTLTTRNNLATVYQVAGRTAEAIALHEQNLTDSERLMGPDHPHTLATRNNLATSYQAAGRTGRGGRFWPVGRANGFPRSGARRRRRRWAPPP